jgi:hypothetical protein
MSWSGWAPFVGLWGTLKCRMRAFGGKDRKYMFLTTFLVIFGYRWGAMLAHGITIFGHRDEGQHESIESCHTHRVAKNLVLSLGAH